MYDGDWTDVALLDLDTGGKTSPHPIIDWNGYLWIANNNYLARSDGATVTATHFNLGTGWEITALFSTNNYIGICAWKKGIVGNLTECKVFFYDGTSTAYSYSISIQDNRIYAATNYNGIIYVATYGRNNVAGMISRLTDNGIEPIKRLKLIVNNAEVSFAVASFAGFNVSQNKLLMCGFNTAATPSAYIFSLGNNEEGEPVAFSFPYLLSTANSNYIYFAKQLTNSKIYIGWRDTTAVGTLSSVNLAGTTYGTATYKPGYTDMGQKVRINYVKFYFKPLVASDSVTVGIDTDYGTANTLAGVSTITHTRDGAVTSKMFRKPITCHAFRPTISWTAGGVAFSKIVVDYTFISD